MSDPVHHPAHYSSNRFGIECIEFARHMTFCQGNAFKYVWRHAEKGGVEDLRKALVYLNWAIENGPEHYWSDQDQIIRKLSDAHLGEVAGIYCALEAIAHGGYSRALEIIKFEIFELENQP